MCIYSKNCGYMKTRVKIIMHVYPGGRRSPRTFFGGARGAPSPQGGEVQFNQSCLTADIWLHSECGNTIPHRIKRSTHCERVRVAPQGGSSGGSPGWLLRVAPQVALHGGSSGWLLRVAPQGGFGLY